MNRLFVPFLFICCLFLTACSDDNEPAIPSDALSLNMLVGDNETTIGGSDVFINNSRNFISSRCGIADLGKKGAFNRNPNLSQVAQEVAVTPGHYYQIMPAGDIRTVAGERAHPINSNYYNVYVDSWIYDKDREIEGAKVRFAECFPKSDKLPEWGAEIKNFDIYNDGSRFEYSFEKGVIVDPNCNIYNYEGSTIGDHIKVDVRDNNIIFNVSGYYYGTAEVIVNVRYESMYSRVRFVIK